MNFIISGIALFNGLKLRGGGTTCTATKQSNGQIAIKIKKQSKRMRQFQLIAFLILLLFSMLPDASNTPEATVYKLIIPIVLFIVLLRYIPKVRILNYHGAEHKVVVAYRNRLPLTLEAVRPISRVTNVCGSMLIVPILLYALILSAAVVFIQQMFVHILLSAIVFLLIGHYFFIRGEEITYVNLYRLLRLPFLKKTPYRFKTNALYKIFDQMGYFIQEHFTTREPSDEELKVAILCMLRLIDEIKL